MAGLFSISHDESEATMLVDRFKWLADTYTAAAMIRKPVLAELQRETPVAEKVIKGVEPGNLRDSIHDEIIAGSGVVALRYTSDADYAGFVVDGTGPHEITPRNARYLHWVDPATGEDVFRSRVWHPGTQPNDFPGRTARRVQPLVESAFGTVFERF